MFNYLHLTGVSHEAVSDTNGNGGSERVVELPPAFSKLPLEKDVCAALFTPHCTPTFYNVTTCARYVIADINCDSQATIAEAAGITKKLSETSTNSGIRVLMSDGEALSPEVFDAVRHRVIDLQIKFCLSATTLSKLPLLGFRNLLNLSVTKCRNLDVRKSYLKANSRLRMIIFWNSTVGSLERNSFTDLPELATLSLEWKISPPFDESQIAHLQRFHCDCDYAWFRKWLEKNPSLLAARNKYEVYSTSHTNNIAFEKDSVFYAIDCAKPVSSWTPRVKGQQAYSVNDDC